MKRTRHLTARQWREAVHDEIGPQVFYLTTKASLLADGLSGKRQKDAKAIVGELEKLRGKLRAWQRGVVEDGKIDLTAELSRLAKEARGIFRDEWKQPVKDGRRARLILQIAREAAHNAMRHGHSSKVEIRLRRGELRVADNGGGWPSRIRDGTGMKLMKQRARELGGKITLERGQEGGAILACHFGEAPG